MDNGGKRAAERDVEKVIHEVLGLKHVEAAGSERRVWAKSRREAVNRTVGDLVMREGKARRVGTIASEGNVMDAVINTTVLGDSNRGVGGRSQSRPVKRRRQVDAPDVIAKEAGRHRDGEGGTELAT